MEFFLAEHMANKMALGHFLLPHLLLSQERILDHLHTSLSLFSDFIINIFFTDVKTFLLNTGPTFLPNTDRHL